MVNDENDSANWGTKRSRLRHAVEVPAQILGSKGPPIDCVIEDLSSAGMFLHYDALISEGSVEPLKVGTRVRVKFMPPEPDAVAVTIQAEIMRNRPHGIGVQLIGLNESQRDAVRAIAVTAVEARSSGDESPARGDRRDSADVRKIMRDCLKTIERHLPNIIWALRTEVASRLRLAAEGKAHPQADEIATDAEHLESKATAIGRTIERRILLGFAEAGGLENTQELIMMSPLAESSTTTESDAPLDMLQDEVVDASAARESP